MKPHFALPNFFLKGLDSKYLGFVNYTFCVATIQLCCYSGKAATDTTLTNGQGCVPKNFDLCTLIFECCIIFMSQNMVLLFIYFLFFPVT